MKKVRMMQVLTCVLVCLIWQSGSVLAAPEASVELEAAGSTVYWYVDGLDYGLAQLSITGPSKITFVREYDRGGKPKFKAVDEAGRPADGLYRWNLMVRSYLDEEILAAIAKDRTYGVDEVSCELQESGELQVFHFSGVFEQIDGKVYLPIEQVEDRSVKPGVDSLGAGGSGIPTKDFVINDDLIVDGSACIGFDCVNGEVFGFDTIRLKENNLRIKFLDTSVGSFPTNDWQITANDSASGGASKFSVDDITNSRTPFTIEARAPSHSLFVDDGGRIGLGTSTPVVDLHVKDGDTPTLRLEQDGSSGFAPQTWDVAGNETSFFIRDATNGSTLPFRIRPGASSNSLVIDGANNIGVGTLSPSADSAVHIVRGDKSAQLRVESTSAVADNADMIYLENNGKVTMRTVNNQAAKTWDFSNDGNFNISRAGTGVNEMSLNDSGDLTIQGELRANNGADVFPDYVFEDGYPLMGLDELQEFLAKNGHLPNVPSAADIAAEGYINMTQLQLKILEKVEELTLYTLDQEKTIRSQASLIDALRSELEVLKQKP